MDSFIGVLLAVCLGVLALVSIIIGFLVLDAFIGLIKALTRLVDSATDYLDRRE